MNGYTSSPKSTYPPGTFRLREAKLATDANNPAGSVPGIKATKPPGMRMTHVAQIARIPGAGTSLKVKGL